MLQQFAVYPDRPAVLCSYKAVRASAEYPISLSRGPNSGLVRRHDLASQRALKSVAHNLGHHAVSGLSFLVPHLFRAAKRSAQLTVSIDMLGEQPLPLTLSGDEPLRLSVGALRERFGQILASEGFDRDAVRGAAVAFRFEDRWPETPATVLAEARAGFQETPDDPAYHCEATVVAANGRSNRQEFCSWHFQKP